MKRILIMSMALDIGGVEKSLVSLLRAVDYDLYSIDLMLVETQGVLQQFLPKQVHVLSFPEKSNWVFIPKGKVLRSLRNAVGWNLNAVRFLYYLLKGLLMRNMGRARQQLIRAAMHTLPEIHGEYSAAIDYTGGYKAFILSRMNAAKKISWVHGDYRVFGRDKKIDRSDYEQLSAIVTVSPTCFRIFAQQFPQYYDKCCVLPNITSKANILEMANQEEGAVFNEKHEGAINLLDITRLDPNKGLDIAIVACSLLVKQQKNIYWYILGDGPQRKRVEKMIQQAEMEDHFFLLGSRANPYPYIKRADIIVHCSRFEGRSVAVDEAMLLGKPIILTNYATAEDQIASGVNGIICEMSAESVCSAIKTLINAPGLMDRYKKALVDYDIGSDQSIKLFTDLVE